MGAQQSKGELLYQQVLYGNTAAIRDLKRQGADLEWRDREGRTPLILACTRGDLLHVAETLIQLGADLNGYRPGNRRHRRRGRARRHHRIAGGTPLHHAAKKGLDRTVLLLLSHGANPLIRNDDCQTPLEVARTKGHSNVVRAIEGHICLFCGWVRELYGPGFLEAIAAQWLSRKIWAVVVPSGWRNPSMPAKFELALYPGLQVSQPRDIIALSKAEIGEPNFNLPDPPLVIFDKATKTRHKFLPANEGDRQQLQRFFEACKGLPQRSVLAPATPATAPVSAPDDLELHMAINASIQSAMQEGPPVFPNPQHSAEIDNTNGWGGPPNNGGFNGWSPLDNALPPHSKTNNDGRKNEPVTGSSHGGLGGLEAGPSGTTVQHAMAGGGETSTNHISSADALGPSAPPIPEEITVDDGPILYPSIDSSPIDLSVPPVEMGVIKDEQKEESDVSSSCVVCLDAPREGVCIPCGHIAGCMSCLNEIRAKKWGCPVCRAKIEQVVKVYNA